jgi:hypothetical protein
MFGYIKRRKFTIINLQFTKKMGQNKREYTDNDLYEV